MLYNVGDKFVVRNVLCEVRFVNNDKAWVFPVDDEINYSAGQFYLSCMAFDVLDGKGKNKAGEKAKPVINKDCGAV